MKPYWEMTAKELGEATKEFDKPIPSSRMRPLTKAQREQFEKARRGPVMAVFSHSDRKRQVTVKLNETTLQRCKEYAFKHHLTLSDVVNMGLANAFRFTD